MLGKKLEIQTRHRVSNTYAMQMEGMLGEVEDEQSVRNDTDP
jgi:hypothetical protein